MNAQAIQIKSYLKKFESQIETMAWGMVDQVLNYQRERLSSGLVKLAARKPKSPRKASSEKASPSQLKKVKLLYNKSGTWSRGGGSYKILGPGKEVNTYDLQDVKTGKKINSTARTLLSRWKHSA